MGSGRHGMVPSVQTWGAPGALLRALDCPHFKFLMMKYHQMASPTTQQGVPGRGHSAKPGRTLWALEVSNGHMQRPGSSGLRNQTTQSCHTCVSSLSAVMPRDAPGGSECGDRSDQTASFRAEDPGTAGCPPGRLSHSGRLLAGLLQWGAGRDL